MKKIILLNFTVLIYVVISSFSWGNLVKVNSNESFKVANQNKVKTINGFNLSYSEIINSIDTKKKTIIIFSVSWCGPCKILKTKLENIASVDISKHEIIYVICDTDKKGERSSDGMPSPEMGKVLEKMGQGYWPFILLFKSGEKVPVSKFPVIESVKDSCPDKLFFERIMDFFKDDVVCQ